MTHRPLVRTFERLYTNMRLHMYTRWIMSSLRQHPYRETHRECHERKIRKPIWIVSHWSFQSSSYFCIPASQSIYSNEILSKQMVSTPFKFCMMIFWSILKHCNSTFTRMLITVSLSENSSALMFWNEMSRTRNNKWRRFRSNKFQYYHNIRGKRTEAFRCEINRRSLSFDVTVRCG